MKTNKDCVFCKIINGEIGQLEFENDFVVAFKTLEPKAKIHLLIVPKKHIVSLSETTNDDKDLLGEMMIVARDLAVKYHLENGYRVPTCPN